MSKPKFPEREVLKDILARSKMKISNSETAYRKSVTDTLQRTDKMVSDIKEYEAKGRDPSHFASGMMVAIQAPYILVINHSFEFLDDLKFYISSLEKYCAELDKTRWKGILEATKKLTEKSVKQQEQLKEKEPSYRA